MNHDDIDLATRLAALEARAPGADRLPALPSRGRRGRFAVSMAMAPVLALAIVATTTAGVVVLSKLAEGYPGIEPRPWNDPSDPDLWAAVRALDARTRTAVLLNVVDGYRHAEIARMPSVPEGTIASWISRGRAALRRELGPDS